MGGKELKTRKANIKKAQAWLNAPPFERPFVFDGLTRLCGKCATKFRKPSKEYQNLLRPELIQLMLEELPEGGQDEQESLDQKLLQQILVSTFMTKLTGKRKEFAKVGHQNEGRILKNFFEALTKDKTLHRATSTILQPGMVKKKDAPYAKTTTDGIGFLEIDGGRELFGIEVKTRVTHATRQREIQNRDLHGDSIDSVHALIQILHHAYVYNLRYILLVIGNSKTQIINGVWVKFDDKLKDTYGQLLKEIYKRCLLWAYEPGATPISKEVVTSAIKSSKQLKGRVDWESFQGHFALWRYVSTNIPGPLPYISILKLRIVERIVLGSLSIESIKIRIQEKLFKKGKGPVESVLGVMRSSY
eukprot:scaffold44858_cov49-Attheya_sp.AAC.2